MISALTNQCSILSFLAAAVKEQRNGLGRNIWTLTPEQITNFLEMFFIFEILYGFTLLLIKISICFLYLRIFPSRNFRIAVWATQVFNACVLVTFIIADMVQCAPLSYFWNSWDGEHHGRCINSPALAWTHAIINIVLDFWMLALPASQVWNLNLPARKKASVFAMFGFGILYVRTPLRACVGDGQTADRPTRTA